MGKQSLRQYMLEHGCEDITIKAYRQWVEGKMSDKEYERIMRKRSQESILQLRREQEDWD